MDCCHRNRPEWLRYVDHTADDGIVVTGPRLADVFERAAAGMFSILCELAHVRPTTMEHVTIEASDREELLVRWLSELNVRHQLAHVLYSEFRVDEVGETRLAAMVGGEKIDPSRHDIHSEIKAVTYCDLELARTANGWRAHVIFDM